MILLLSAGAFIVVADALVKEQKRVLHKDVAQRTSRDTVIGDAVPLIWWLQVRWRSIETGVARVVHILIFVAVLRTAGLSPAERDIVTRRVPAVMHYDRTETEARLHRYAFGTALRGI